MNFGLFLNCQTTADRSADELWKNQGESLVFQRGDEADTI